MSWPTVIWSMVAASAITIALPHLIIGLRQRGARVHLFFALAGFAVAWLAVGEWRLMRAVTTEQAGRLLQLGQAPVFVVMVAIIGFVWVYFGTARPWLGLLAGGLRAVALIANFIFPPNMNFREITALRHFEFLGDTVAMPVGPRNPWLLLGYVSSLLVLIFVIDAAVRLWRQGTPDARRRAGVVGGGIVFFILASQTTAILVNTGLIDFPYFISIPFMAIIAAMGFELTYSGVRAARLSEELQAGEERMSLVAESARLALWEWDSARDVVWMTAEGRAILGLPPEGPINFAAMIEKVHPDDRVSREAAIRQAVGGGGTFELEYRLMWPDGTLRWITVRGRCAHGQRLLGVSIDITRQKQLDAEARRQREELGHLARVALVGEMATSLAHELNQPLTAIVMNAGAAQRFLAKSDLDLVALRELLGDISADGHRAGEVIRSIKGMVRKVEATRGAVDLNAMIAGVLRLVRADALTHDCAIVSRLQPGLPVVSGDPVQLQQVMLNLILNAFDAMRAMPREVRRVEIASGLAGNGMIEISVRDSGPGLPTGEAGRVFERFYSTKPDGMGMGLAIARSIIESHAGTLDAENAGPGARFWFHLPVPAPTASPVTS